MGRVLISGYPGCSTGSLCEHARAYILHLFVLTLSFWHKFHAPLKTLGSQIFSFSLSLFPSLYPSLFSFLNTFPLSILVSLFKISFSSSHFLFLFTSIFFSVFFFFFGKSVSFFSFSFLSADKGRAPQPYRLTDENKKHYPVIGRHSEFVRDRESVVARSFQVWKVGGPRMLREFCTLCDPWPPATSCASTFTSSLHSLPLCHLIATKRSEVTRVINHTIREWPIANEISRVRACTGVSFTTIFQHTRQHFHLFLFRVTFR